MPALLDTSQVEFPTVDDARSFRWQLRSDLRAHTSLSRVGSCGYKAIGDSVGIRVSAERGAGYSNLETCGSVWACPVCSAKIAAVRAQEIATAITSAAGQGYSVSFFTLTLRHNKYQRLDFLLDSVKAAWRGVITGREWQRVKKSADVRFIKSLEITYGVHGWHPHLHLLVFHREGEYSFSYLRDFLFSRWCASVSRLGLDAVDKALNAKEVKLSDVQEIADYMSKSLGSEMTQEAFKTKTAGRNAFSLLKHAIQSVESDDFQPLKLWYEYEAATKGRRSLTWSKNLKRDLGIVEVTDEDIVETDEGGETILSIPVAGEDGWKRLRSVFNPAHLLKVVEEGGAEAGISWLIERRIAFNYAGVTFVDGVLFRFVNNNDC